MITIPEILSKDITDKYDIVSNTFIRKDKGEVNSEFEIEIGDSKQDDFYPQVKLMRWENECNFSVRLTENGKETSTVSSKNDKVTWEKGNFKIESYEVEDAFKYVWYLKEKPATNKVQFSIQSKGLNFYYQPELTQKEIDDGAFRPENVVGSYAVYMENPGTNWVGGKEYKAGKFGHIFRPHLYDSNGLEAWGDLHIENGLYEVTIPQEFLDKAVFPIKSNDTFGYTTNGSSNYGGISDNYLGCYRFTSPSNVGVISSISAYAFQNQSGSRTFKGVIVLQSDLSLIGYTNKSAGYLYYSYNSTNPATAQLISANFASPPTLIANTDYYLCTPAHATGSNGFRINYDTGTTNYFKLDNTNSYTTPAAPGSFSYQNNYKLSIYATYTPAATGTNFQINISDTFKEVTKAQINIGNSWHEITSAKVNISNSWRTIF